MGTTTCQACGHEIEMGEWPFCPHPLNGNLVVIGDDIPGGLEIKHGLCNPDGTPRTYYSKSEMAKEAKRRGLVNYVRHAPPQGSDKSDLTTKWV